MLNININMTKDTPRLPHCPSCDRAGQKVQRITVEHQVCPDVQLAKGDAEFFLCRTPECQVAYYTMDGKDVIEQDQVRHKIWFKTSPGPTPICYCLNITEEEILQHVAVDQCCSTLKDIQQHTGANTGTACLTKNPAGG